MSRSGAVEPFRKLTGRRFVGWGDATNTTVAPQLALENFQFCSLVCREKKLRCKSHRKYRKSERRSFCEPRVFQTIQGSRLYRSRQSKLYRPTVRNLLASLAAFLSRACRSLCFCTTLQMALQPSSGSVSLEPESPTPSPELCWRGLLPRVRGLTARLRPVSLEREHRQRTPEKKETNILFLTFGKISTPIIFRVRTTRNQRYVEFLQ